MALLPDADRIAVWADCMQANTDPTSAVKTAWKAAVDYTDGWLDSQEATYVAGLPAAFRTGTTARTKRLMFLRSVLKRFEVL